MKNIHTARFFKIYFRSLHSCIADYHTSTGRSSLYTFEPHQNFSAINVKTQNCKHHKQGINYLGDQINQHHQSAHHSICLAFIAFNYLEISEFPVFISKITLLKVKRDNTEKRLS